MAIANKNDLSHIVRTTQQWTTSYDSYECIPEGVLCVEFTPDGHVKAKIGNGHDIFSKLPYIGGADLTNYYTKSETAQCVEEIIKANRFIRIKGILQNKDQLPSHADCGDLYFVISQNQSSSNKYDEYVYSPSNTWENLGSIPIDIDLSEYAKIVYVDEKIDEVNERIDDIEQHGTHTHANKDILDLITAAFTAEEKDKLSTLYNYDDTELRELITQASHTHSNKDILDAISAPFTKEDKSKLDQLNPYDDSILKEKITALERLAHEHSNKRILDRTTASFTTEYERKIRWIRLYTGCTGMEEGIAGLVPAAQAGEEDYVLSGSGEWVPQTGGGGTYELPIATTSTLGGIKVGDGLEIDANGKLSVVGGGGGGDSIAEGDGITITTDPQTGVKTISVDTGDGLQINQDGELEIDPSIIPEVTEYEAGEAIEIAEVTHEDEFRVQNQEYFFDTRGLTCGLNARVWTTVNDGDILAAMCIHNNGGNQVPLFVGLTEDSVKVSQNYNSTILGPNGSFDYRGKTWYFTADYALSGTDGQDTQGHIQTLPTTYSFNSTPSNFVPAAKDLIDLAVLLSDLEYPVISVKYNKGLTVNQNNELEVEIPPATETDLGGIKVGTGFTYLMDGTLNAKPAMPPFDVGDALELLYDDPDALPDGYAHVDYVSSNPASNSTSSTNYGRARTLIDYTPENVTKLEIKMARDNDYQDSCFVGCRVAGSANQFVLWHENRSPDTQVAFAYGSKSYNDARVNVSYITGQVHEIEANIPPAGTSGNITVLLNGNVIKTYTKSGNPLAYKLGIFQSNRANEWEYQISNGRIYYLRLYEGNTLAVNLIPAVRLSDEVVGFYDNVNDKFYTSSTDYPFTTDMSTLNPDPANRKLNVVPATANTLGGIKVGSGLSIESDGTLSVVGGSGGGNYSAGDAIEIDTSLFNVDAIRWDISDIKDPIQTFSANGPWVQARYIQFRDNSNNVILIDSGSGVWSDDTAVSYYQDLTLANMIANTQKMCASWRSPDLTMKLTFLLDSPVNVSNIAKFRILLGDDEPCRDPKAWSIYVRNAITQEWYLVHSTVDAQLSNTRNVWTDDFLLENPNRSTINVKYGNGLTLNASNELEVDLPVASDSTLGGVIVGDGILVDNDGTISVDPTIIPEVTEYEAGTAISIEDAEHGGVTFDAWDSGTGWENVCYQNSTGNAVVTYTYEAHSPISNSYTLPAGATHIRAIAYDQNDTMLWTSFSWIDANNYHFASTSPEDGHYNDWFDIPEGAVKVNFGVRHSKLNTSQSMNLNDIKSVDITIQTISEIEVDVWTGVTGWTNGDYYSGTSDTFTRDWYYTYHYDPTAYIPVPEGALKIRVIGISNENDSHFEGGGANIFDSNHHHIGWLPCCTATGEWVDIPEGTVYVQPEVKWSNGNTRTISAADIKSVTLAWKLPALEINQAINVKYGDGLTVNQNNELEVNIGTGLEIDPQTGAINVTGGGSGGGNSGNYIEGEAIEFEEGASRLPTGYTELENISNVSASYIDTGYIPNTDTQLSIIANIHRGTTSWQTLFGARDAVNPGGTEYAFFVRLNDNYNFYPRITGDQYTYMPNQTYDEKIRIDINNTTATVTRQDGSSYSYTQTGSLSNLSTTLAIFALHNQTGYVDNGIIDLYSFKIYENNTIVKDFVPCKRNSDDAIGLIDIINNVFYTNLGTGTFTAGRILTNTSINVKYGTGLSVDPVTNELFVDGQLPEGTIIKKLTYTGNGASTNNIQFDKKPLAILSLNGSSGQNYGSLIPTFIDSPYLHGVFGGSTNSGTTFRSSMSYDDSTNTLSLTNTSDEGLAFNIANKPYVMYYLTKGHTGSGTSVNNEVSVIKTITYTGTGTATNNIQFPETPDMLLSIYGPTSDGFIASSSVPITSTSIAGIYEYGSASRYGGVVSCGMSFNDSTNILTLSGGVDDGARFNISGATYIVTYSVNEVIPSTMPYDAGEAISIETIGGLQPTDYSNDDFVDSIMSMNAGSIVKAADKSSFTLTASYDDCYTRGSSGQANGSYPFNVKASTKYRFAWDSADPTVHGKVYTYENGLYDAMMHEIDQYDSPYLEFTTSPNTTFIQARFGVMYAGDSITYSNVRLYEVIEDEDQYNEISVKHGDGLTVNERNELEVNIGTGLAFDPQTGAINVTGGGGSGDTVAQGAGIDITTDQQTGNKVIAVNAGTGLQVDQTTNELEIDDSVVTEDDELSLVFVPDDYQPS